MIPDKNAANAVGGKTARACDNCVRRRARWFCAADDAFLCQSCDSSVHSANSLARRHERVRLKTASSPGDHRERSAGDGGIDGALPTWHRGFTRKARTPRHGKAAFSAHRPANKTEDGPSPNSKPNPAVLVPELGADDTASQHEESEAQLLYRVPVLDPFESAPVGHEAEYELNKGWLMNHGKGGGGGDHDRCDVDHLTSFLPSELELAEFAADVEVLLGKGMDEECFGMEELGLLGACKEEEDDDDSCFLKDVKREEEEDGNALAGSRHVCMGIEAAAAREPFELRFEDFDDAPPACGGAEMKGNDKWGGESEVEKKSGKKILLRLDYEAVIGAWAGQGSPWTGGERPALNPDDCWLDSMVAEMHVPGNEDLGGTGPGGHGGGAGDGGREARVSRYREKRRTRLFSKKIRYEVRKLNAEKRPRMKGRFVKRASFLGPAASAPPFPLLSK